MKIVIEIDKEDLEIIKHNVAVDNPLCPIGQKEMVTKIANGIPKADYENRLKADMVAMLTELQLEIEEKSIIDYDEDLYDGGECVISISEINEIIQQKISSLKEE